MEHRRSGTRATSTAYAASLSSRAIPINLKSSNRQVDLALFEHYLQTADGACHWWEKAPSLKSLSHSSTDLLPGPFLRPPRTPRAACSFRTVRVMAASSILCIVSFDTGTFLKPRMLFARFYCLNNVQSKLLLKRYSVFYNVC